MVVFVKNLKYIYIYMYYIYTGGGGPKKGEWYRKDGWYLSAHYDLSGSEK